MTIDFIDNLAHSFSFSFSKKVSHGASSVGDASRGKSFTFCIFRLASRGGGAREGL